MTSGTSGWRQHVGEWQHDRRLWGLVPITACDQCSEVGPAIRVGEYEPWESDEAVLCARCLALALADLAGLPALLAAAEAADNDCDDEEDES